MKGLALLFLLGPATACSAIPEGTRWYRIAQVVDGDTLRLEDGRRVRLLGIDAPELSTIRGVEVAAYVRSRVRSGPVGLSYEGREIDDYGRMLAHVWLEDGVLLERELIKLGFAKVYERQNFRDKVEFKGLQEKARRAKLGIWRKKF